MTMLKAAPVGTKRLLHSKTVADSTPLMASDAMLRMLTVGSLNGPALRDTNEAPTLCTAYAIVLQGADTSHAGESVPVTGLTVTEVPAAADAHAGAMHKNAKTAAHTSQA